MRGRRDAKGRGGRGTESVKGKAKRNCEDDERAAGDGEVMRGTAQRRYSRAELPHVELQLNVGDD